MHIHVHHDLTPGPRSIRPIRQCWAAASPVREDFSFRNPITLLFLSPNGHINLKLLVLKAKLVMSMGRALLSLLSF